MEIFLELLKKIISYKSISTNPAFIDQINLISNFLIDQFKMNSFEVEQITGYDNPIVFASYVKSQDYKTILIYGHYDVQPADIKDGWDSDPFILTEKNNKVFGRGIVDNKGQFAVHLYTVFKLIKEEKIKYNIKFILEGNEETGSPKLEQFIFDNVDKLKADFVLFSDGELTMEHPSIDAGFRGIFNVKLTIKTSLKDNHSGLYGGTIPNAATVLTDILSKLHNSDGLLNLPDLQNSIENIPEKIHADNKKRYFDQSKFLENTGAKERFISNLDFYTSSAFLTSAEITTLTSGYQDLGYKNAIPGEAIAKINFRISPLKKTADVYESFIKFLEINVPSYAEYSIETTDLNEPINIDIDNTFTKSIMEKLEKNYGKEPFYVYCPAIVPVAGYFQDYLKVPVVSVGLGNEDCNMHGANENFDIELISKALAFSRSLFEGE